MKCKISLSLVMIFAFAGTVLAQSYQHTDLGVKAHIQSMDVEVQFFSPQIVRVRFFQLNGTGCD